MKGFKLFLTTFALPWLASASPSESDTPPDAPMGGDLVTNPVVLAELKALHSVALQKMREGGGIPVGANDTDQQAHTISAQPEKRNLIAILAGLLWVETLAGIGIQVGSTLYSFFRGGDNTVWDNTQFCRVDFETWAGGAGTFQSWDKGKDGADGERLSQNIAWNNPETTDPPVWFFYNDHLGYYSVQFTATDRVAWSGIPGTTKCVIEGICNPQYIFYHYGYNVILNTWQSQGDLTSCQYTKGADCKGLCFSGVRSQFTKGGDIWGGKCAVPCRSDGGDNAIRAEGAKIMVLGDSISEGMEDDFTWRWRLSYWIKDILGRKPKFVGPSSGTHGPIRPSQSLPNPPLFPDEPEYYDHSAVMGLYNDAVPGDFVASDHASKWGRTAMQGRDAIGDWVREYQPDYLLVLLGFNDMGWWKAGADDTVGTMGDLVNNARTAKGDIRILVGNVVHRTFIGGRQDLVDKTNRYNVLLKDNVNGWWFRFGSPMVYVDVNTNYNCRPQGGCPDAYDGLHPNTMGEYHIAQAFARALKTHFGYIGPDFQVPEKAEPRIISTPTSVVSSSSDEGLNTAWQMVKSARGYDIRARIQGASGWWFEGPVSPNTFTNWHTWVLNGQNWEFQVRTRGDGDDVSAWSGSTFATANIKTAPGPANIVAVPVGDDGVQITWAAVQGYNINRYAVIIWDQDEPGAFIDSRPTFDTSIIIKGLRNGHRYGIWVATWINLNNRPAGGLPAAGRDVFIGSGAPPAPSNLRVTNVDPTTVNIEWSGSGGAAGYAVYIYTLSWEPHGTPASVTGTSYGVAYLFPGTWNYRYCVTAYNGNLESAPKAVCVVPPVYPGYSKRDTTVVPGGGGGGDNLTLATRTNASTVYDTESMIADLGLKALVRQLMIQDAAATGTQNITAG